MTRIHPPALTLALGEEPRAKLNITEVRLRLRDAGIDEAKHEGIIAILQRTMDEYALSRLVNARGATPAEVRQYVAALAKATKQMLTLLGHDNRIGKALITRAYATGALPVGFACELSAALGKLATGIVTAAGATADAKSESGKMAEAARHRKLAEGMLLGFAEQDWPIDLESENGLLFQLFVICLESVGERQTRPKRVFDDVRAAILEEETLQ